MNFLYDLLKSRPSLLSNYIKLGTFLTNKVGNILNKVMEHLLTIQGIDLKTEPGDKYRGDLEKALKFLFENESKDNTNFDLHDAWVKRALEKTRAKLNVSEESFNKLTDLSNLDCLPGDTVCAEKELVIKDKAQSILDELAILDVKAPKISKQLTKLKKAAKKSVTHKRVKK